MQQKELSELIDHYLLRKISAEDLERLNHLRATHSDIDQRIKEDEEVMKVLKYLRFRELRQKLSNIDAENENHSGTHFKDWLFGFAFILVLLSVALFWCGRFFNPESLATRYFHHCPDAFVVSVLAKDPTGEIAIGIHEFNTRNYSTAWSIFHAHSADQNEEISFFATWNALLSQLAMRGPDEELNENILKFSTTSYEPYSAESKKLFRLINSGMYKNIFLRMASPISSLKPSLM